MSGDENADAVREPDLTPCAPRSPGVALSWCLLAVLAYAFLSIVTAQVSLVGPNIVNSLLFGWISFLRRVVPQTSVSGEGIVSAVALTVVTVALLRLLDFRRKPVSTDADAASDRSAAESPGSRRRWAVRGVLAAVLLFPAGMAFTGVCRNLVWFVSTDARVWSSGREASARSRAKNQLKQLGLSLHNFHEEHGEFPAGGTFGESGEGLHSWTTALLPYMQDAELNALHATLKPDQPWDSAANAQQMRRPIAWLLGPTMPKSTWADERGFAATHFAANSWLLGPNSSLSMRDIKDGTTNTLLCGQIRDEIPAWGNPVNWRDPTRRLNSAGAFGSLHIGVVQFLLADGSVRSISENVDPQVMRALSSPAGGEPVGAF